MLAYLLSSVQTGFLPGIDMTLSSCSFSLFSNGISSKRPSCLICRTSQAQALCNLFLCFVFISATCTFYLLDSFIASLPYCVGCQGKTPVTEPCLLAWALTRALPQCLQPAGGEGCVAPLSPRQLRTFRWGSPLCCERMELSVVHCLQMRR